MPTPIETPPSTFNGWTFHLRPGDGSSNRLLLLLHGWKGDERSMGVFVRSLPAGYTLLSPRAPNPDPSGGYTWRTIHPGSWGFPTLDDLRPSVEALLGFIDAWSASAGLDGRVFDLAGFSQGAALACTLTVLHPQRVHALAVLSGFLPDSAAGLLRPDTLQGKEIFISHGRQDDMVPIDRARSMSAALQAAGARVEYCETDSAHKVGKECIRGMSAFFTRML